jgi:hypothetical protein
MALFLGRRRQALEDPIDWANENRSMKRTGLMDALAVVKQGGKGVPRPACGGF